MNLLTPAEIEELTGRERPTAQARELAFQRIPYKTRRDGSLIVYRIHTPYATQEKRQTSPEVLAP